MPGCSRNTIPPLFSRIIGKQSGRPRENDAQHISEPVEADVRALTEKLETAFQLSRTEARFLQSLVVRHRIVILIDIER